MSVQGRTLAAHRVAHLAATGEWPAQVCHRCDNPGCVNAEHLFSGTAFTNMQDAIQKGRKYVRSPDRGFAEITDSVVIELRKRAESGEPYESLAKEFNLSKYHLGKIVRRELWQHVEAETPLPESFRARGSRQHKSKLTDDKVIEIRKRWAAGESLGSLAQAFDVRKSNVEMIVKGLTWKHLSVIHRPE